MIKQTNVRAVTNDLVLRLIFLFVLLVTWNLGARQNSEASEDATEAEERLFQKLLVNYSTKKYVLPTRNRGGPVQLRIDLSLRQIAEVDEVKQGIRVSVWFRQYWNNPLLTWSPRDYQNITSLHVDKELIWIPDTCMYNKAIIKENTDILYRRLSTRVILSYDGNCTWLAPVALFSQCYIDVTKFPFDEHVCPLTFGSWTYHGDQMDINYTQKYVDTLYFTPNAQWKIVKGEFKRNVSFYQGAQQFYPDVTLHLHIRRLPLYHTLNLIIPCTLITALSFITFVLPTDKGERISLVMTVLLAMSVYMLIMTSILPQSSNDIPELGVYFLCVIVEIALSLFATSLTVKIGERETEMPKWVDIGVNNYLARLTCVGPLKVPRRYVLNIGYNTSSADLSKTTDSSKKGHAIVDPKDQEIQNGENPNVNTLRKSFLVDSPGKKMQSELAVIAEHFREKHASQARVSKWKKAAKVLDRLFLVVFSTLFVIITLIFFQSGFT